MRKNYINETVETIYFGGGTPSFIDIKHVEYLLNIIRNNFSVENNAEITLEANPDDLTVVKTNELYSIGVNRLSIGIQSFDEADLRMMNRAHNAQQAIDSINNAKSAGFNNLSIDLIYGIHPEAGKIAMQTWERNLDTAIHMEIDHLSCYALTVEHRTVLADLIRKNKMSVPNEEEAVAEFEKLVEATANAGYEHYEISNFARNKKYSKHNTSYWQRKKYLGVGPSAHSFNGDSRQWNIANNQLYIQSIQDGKIPFEIEYLTTENKFNEYILTSLRTMWGTDLKLIEREFGKVLLNELNEKLSVFIKENKIQLNSSIITLTETGKLFADAIAADLMVVKNT